MKAEFLRPTAIIDYTDPKVVAMAKSLAGGLQRDVDVARACFLFVRDAVLHSSDHQRDPVTCVASDVLRFGTGYCFAKSHLLAALLRANGIPAGFCYQRLSMDDIGPPYCLHGFNGVYLQEHGWYRVDPRGCKPGVTSDFVPPRECLAYTPKLAGEVDFPEIWTDPLPVVVEVLSTAVTWQEVIRRLPDVEVCAGV